MNTRAFPMVAVSLLLLTLLLWTSSLAVSDPGEQTAATAVPQTASAQRDEAVQVTPTATHLPSGLRDDRLLHDRSLITGEPCAPPCWRGITPGVTRWDDALAILEDDPTLGDLQFETTGRDAHVYFVYFAEPGGGETSNFLVSPDAKTVAMTYLMLAPEMTVGELIEAHGEPTYAVRDLRIEDFTNLIYPEKQMVVSAFVTGQRGTLSDSSEIVRLIYARAADMDVLMEISSLHEWEGYASSETYGPNAPFEVTAVPTPTLPTLTPSRTPTPQATFPPPPSAEDLSFDTLYLHPTNMFAIGQPVGFAQVSPSQTASLAQVNLVNPNVQAVIDAYVQDPQEPMTTEGLSGFFSQDVLDSTWDYFTSWDETGRETSATDLTIDFVVRYQQQEYIVRQRAWTDGAWIYSVRVLTPSNAREYRNAVLDGAVRSMMGFTQFAGTPMNWVAYYDPASGMVIRYPQSWPVTAGGPGYLTTMSSPDGALLHVETRSTEAVDSRAEAETVLREIDPNAAIKTATNVTKGGTDTSVAVRGWQFTYTTSADGEVQRGITEVVTGPDGTVYVAMLKAPADEATASTEYEQIMNTFGVLPPLNLSEGSP